jgi:UDP-N-acetylmuramoylalanine--D-glutamate ligase
MGDALVVGLGVTGEAVARQLARRGWSVVVAEDRPTDATRARAGTLAELGIEVAEAPGAEALDALVDATGLLVPSPGVPRRHRATTRALGAGIPVWTEFELAARWSSVPLVAVTGTNGKTTVTTMVRGMLEASGQRTELAGNNDLPLVDALDLDLDVVVVEASSFRLEFTETFSPGVGTWLNLAPDHLDWHDDMASYAAAKAKLWANAGPHDAAVANAEDPVVLEAARASRARLVTFGLAAGDWRVAGEQLVGPDGPVVAVAELARDLPHDRANALAAAATATAAGATPDAVASVLRSFRGSPTGSRRWASMAGCAGSTTRRPRTRTPPSPRCAGSPRSCSWPVGATRASTSRCWPTRPTACGPWWPSARPPPRWPPPSPGPACR